MTEPTPGIDWAALPARPWVARADSDGDWGITEPSSWLVGWAALSLPRDKQQAINRLWSAAPELYEALRAIVEAEEADLEDGQFCDNAACEQCAPRVARLNAGCAALTKAERGADVLAATTYRRDAPGGGSEAPVGRGE